VTDPAPGAGSIEEILHSLQERAKELSCLYRVDEVLRGTGGSLEDVLRRLLDVLPAGWQHPAVCQAKVTCRGLTVSLPGWQGTPWAQSAGIVVQGQDVGTLSVEYTEPRPTCAEGPFLSQERKLLDTVAERIAQYVRHRDLAEVFDQPAPQAGAPRQDWRVLLDVLRHTDMDLFRRLARKMLNHLAVNGAEEAKALLRRSPAQAEGEQNKPLLIGPHDTKETAEEAFVVAADCLGQREILALLETWIREDRAGFLLVALESSYTTLVEIENVLERYQHSGIPSRDLSPATQAGARVALVRRLLTDDPGFLLRARQHLEIEDFFGLLRHAAVLPKSHGRLGGKSAGLFLAERVLYRAVEHADILGKVRVPRTFYIPSDGVLQFLAFNGLDDLYNWRYRDVSEIRQAYPNVVEVFRSSRFTPELIAGLAAVLDDLGDQPLIVRSSSLLEDRLGAAFSGKYKSLFLANQGSRAERLRALEGAVAEVYASIFGPDAIQYRAERGLLDHHEEMAVMVQQVVGARVGRYFLPAFSGVGLSNNELRWSPRIRRDDGLLRIVPGLGTRAVDRVGDDYPVLVAPGQPGLRANASVDEVVRYAPRLVDVIDLVSGTFETVEAERLLREVGSRIPGIEQLVSVLDHDHLRRPSPLDLAAPGTRLLFTFEGLFRDTAFLTRMRTLLAVLKDAMDTPVDVEFASDGRELYLLQCRPQTGGADAAPSPLPRDVPPEDVLFTARRFVSNGRVPDLTHVVYVDGEAYAALGSEARLRAVGRCIGRLNDVLPRRQFVLMGPGRWGSRGDLRLGVSVGYADINHAALLVEVARRRGGSVPDLSFGTHFFQDLVESAIRYLPLYPDDPGVRFNEEFLRQAPSALTHFVPDLAELADVVRVIAVPLATGGRRLRGACNAEVDEAIAWFVG
jgi:pyruvate,water dikinase